MPDYRYLQWVHPLIRFFTDRRVALTVTVLLCFFISFQNIGLGLKKFNDQLPSYPFYNNYLIFEHSFHHLVQGSDLYKSYPEEHWDIFKYTPTFAFFFGLFAWMPHWLGMSMWHLLNGLVLFAGIRSLPRLSNGQKQAAYWLSLTELITSLQNQQSNALIAGLMLLAFSAFEKNKFFVAGTSLMAAAFIKPFALALIPVCIFYKPRSRIAVSLISAFAVLALIPLLLLSYPEYLVQLKSYVDMLVHDHDVSLGYSVMALLQSVFPLELDKTAIVFAGLVLLLLPLLRVSEYSQYRFRFLMLVSVLIWVVIFNHKSESPSFVIAMCALSLWFFAGKKTGTETVLFVFAFLLTGLSSSDIFPRSWRENYVHPYALKALPCLLIWLYAWGQLIFFRHRNNEPGTDAISDTR